MIPYYMSITDLARNLNLRKSGSEYHGACPVCGYTTGFQLTQEKGQLLAYCHAKQCNLTDFFRVLYKKGQVPTRKGLKPLGVAIRQKTYYAKSDLDACDELWRKAVAATGTLVETYLMSRGLNCQIPPSIAFLEKHKHTESGQELPVMLAKVCRPGTDIVTGIHRTFLKYDGSGKAAVEPNKKSLGNILGGAVYLGNPGETVGVSEGIENGLTYQQATGTPTLAALSAGGLENLILPALPLASTVVIIADNDTVGLQAAAKAGDRWLVEGRQVMVITHPEDGMDLNDLLVSSIKPDAGV
jgi:hypothetical protein